MIEKNWTGTVCGNLHKIIRMLSFGIWRALAISRCTCAEYCWRRCATVIAVAVRRGTFAVEDLQAAIPLRHKLLAIGHVSVVLDEGKVLQNTIRITVAHELILHDCTRYATNLQKVQSFTSCTKQLTRVCAWLMLCSTIDGKTWVQFLPAFPHSSAVFAPPYWRRRQRTGRIQPRSRQLLWSL